MVEDDIDNDHFAGAVRPSLVRRFDLLHNVRNGRVMRVDSLLDVGKIFFHKQMKWTEVAGYGLGFWVVYHFAHGGQT